MKRIPTRQELLAQGPILLETVVLNPNDRSLPKPRGKTEKPKAPCARELYKLKRTREAGGPVDDSSTIGAPARANLQDLKQGEERTKAEKAFTKWRQEAIR